MFDNELNEILLIMMEEAAEVQKICSKIIRFGEHEYHPQDPLRKTNGEKLLSELADLEAMKLLALCKFTYTNTMTRDIINKVEKLKSWSSIDHKTLQYVIDICHED